MTVGLQIRPSAHPSSPHRSPLTVNPLTVNRPPLPKYRNIITLPFVVSWLPFLIPQFKILPIISTPILLKKKF
jgi:hypothetical protein